MKKTFKQHLAKTTSPDLFLSYRVNFSYRVNISISSYRVYLFGNRSTMLATVTAAKA